MKTISQAYILGIKEGRAMLNASPEIDRQAAYDNAKRLALSHSGDMKDLFRGERDFWKNQLKEQS